MKIGITAKKIIATFLACSGSIVVCIRKNAKCMGCAPVLNWKLPATVRPIDKNCNQNKKPVINIDPSDLATRPGP
jgi:hypothetical protein